MIICYSNEPSQNLIVFILTCLFIGALITIVIITFENNNPKAIDVYRNKTELKINGYYSDSCFVPTDSIVIFKK